MNLRMLAKFWLVLALAGVNSSLMAEQGSPHIARIGYVDPVSPGVRHGVPMLRQRLAELGWVEGRNLIIEARSAEGHTDRLPSLFQELIAAEVDVIVTHSTPGAMAARNATRTVPIVVGSMMDPVEAGVADSLARPGGNVTGISMGIDKALLGKYLEFLQDTVPHLKVVAILGALDNPTYLRMAQQLQSIAVSRGLKAKLFKLRDPKELDITIERASRQAQAAVFIPDPIAFEYNSKITALAAKHRLPAIYGLPEFIDAGGLMAYSVDRVTLFRRTAEYVDKVLRGTKPADLPFEQPTQFRLAVNLKAARALGLTIPDSILVRAEDVIQ
jgi:putative ABC transport system substrate-binding protein